MASEASCLATSASLRAFLALSFAFSADYLATLASLAEDSAILTDLMAWSVYAFTWSVAFLESLEVHLPF